GGGRACRDFRLSPFRSRSTEGPTLRYGYLHGMPRHHQRPGALPELPNSLRTGYGGPDRIVSLEFEIVIVGAGPAGLAAACAAAESGSRVAILDDTPWLGGQIWRGQSSRP